MLRSTNGQRKRPSIWQVKITRVQARKKRRGKKGRGRPRLRYQEEKRRKREKKPAEGENKARVVDRNRQAAIAARGMDGCHHGLPGPPGAGDRHPRGFQAGPLGTRHYDKHGRPRLFSLPVQLCAATSTWRHLN